MNPRDWLDRISGGTSVNAAAQHAHVPQKTLDTQLRSPKGLKPEMVIRLARAYGTSPVGALVEFGFLNDDEVGDVAKIYAALGDMNETKALERATDDQLLVEIGKRLEDRRKALEKSQRGPEELLRLHGLSAFPTMDDLELADSAAAPLRPDVEGDEEPPLP